MDIYTVMFIYVRNFCTILEILIRLLPMKQWFLLARFTDTYLFRTSAK